MQGQIVLARWLALGLAHLLLRFLAHLLAIGANFAGRIAPVSLVTAGAALAAALCTAFRIALRGAFAAFEYAVNHHNWRQVGRLNNPFAESLNLDPDGRFIRRHLPELAHLPTSALHAPHLAGSDVETNGYPPPSVDRKSVV